jgi:hemoglobin
MARLRAHQLAFLMAAIGGPNLFTGRAIAEAHAELKITNWAFDELIGHLATTLTDLGTTPAAVARLVRRLEPLRSAVVDEASEEPDGAGAVSPPAAGPIAAPPGY